MKILSAQQMNEVDRLSSKQFGVPSLVLMENAGMNLLLTLQEYFEDLEEMSIAILCGKGNNGGDGMVLARQLGQRGILADLYLLGRIEDVSGDARTNLDINLDWGMKVSQIGERRQWEEVDERLDRYDIIVDALLGTGLSKPLHGLYAQVVSSINLSNAFVLSVDIPSGMFADSLTAASLCVHADATVTFSCPKIAHILNEDQEAVGDLHIVPIGNPPQLLEREEYRLNLITQEEAAALLPPREIASHKGNFGHVALISGSSGKSGAAALCSSAALRTGSGLVTAFCPEVIQDVVASHRPEVMTQGFPCTDSGTFSHLSAEPLLEQLETMDAAGMGPGLTTDPETARFTREVIRKAPLPLILDADALNVFQGQLQALRNEGGQPLVLTPHPGEFARLVDRKVPEVLAQRLSLASNFASEHHVWLVLKGFRTLIASPEGNIHVCPLGNPGMATAGMGDVLTGVLTSLLGRFCAGGWTSPDKVTEALILGVFLHSLAGDLAAMEIAPDALNAGDVIDALSDAFELLDETHEEQA